MSRRVIGIIAALAALGISLWLDPWAWRHLEVRGVYEKDWGRMLRVLGSLVFWTPFALAVWLERRHRAPAVPNPAWLLLAGPVLAGGVGELLKIVLRRERPGLHDGAWVFRAFTDRPFDTRDIGLPSSHAVVAFGGAAVAARMFPGAAPLIYVLAAACAATRVMARAHFASDIVAGAVAGWLVGTLLWRRFGGGRTTPST